MHQIWKKKMETNCIFNRPKLQCLSTINMVFNDEDKVLIKSLYLKGLVLLTQY